MKTSMPFAVLVTRALVAIALLNSFSIRIAQGQVISTYAGSGTSRAAHFDAQKADSRQLAASPIGEAGSSQRGVTLKKYAALPLAFEENVGQVDSSARFISNLGGYSAWLSNGELVLIFPGKHGKSSAPEKVRIKMVGSDKNAEPQGTDLLPGISNYYLGNDPAKWKTDVRRFRQVRYHDIYPGVDLLFYGNRRQLEFDFDVAPGASVRPISLRVEGAKVRTEKDALELRTPSGNVALLKKPALYQGEGDSRRSMAGKYVVRRNHVAFEVGNYDKRQALVIDPALVYSTFAQIGNPASDGPDVPFAIAADSTGAAYVTGQTYGSDGTYSAFVIKLDPTGSNLVYETRLGGKGQYDAVFTFVAGQEIALDVTGNVYIAGMTLQPDFPTTAGVYSATSFCSANSGQYVGCLEPFAAKLDSNGTLVYSTFLVQSSAVDTVGPVPSSIAVDASGAMYLTGTVAGQTNVLSVGGLSTTAGAFQTTRKTSSSSFVLKLHPDGSALDYATYLGGSLGETPGGIAVDSSGVAHVDGGTFSLDFPTTTGAIISGTSTFLTRVKADGTGLVYSTTLPGPSSQSVGMAIAMDASGSDYLAGGSAPSITNASIGTTLPLFVAKIDSSGNQVYANLVANQMVGYQAVDAYYYGTPPFASISTDSTGAAYVGNGALPTDAIPAPSLNLNKLDPTGAVVYSQQVWSVPGGFNPFGITTDSNQNFYVAAWANFTSDPAGHGIIPGIGTTVGAYQTLPGANVQEEMFVQKWAQTLGAAVAVPNPRAVTFPTTLQPGNTSVPFTVQLANLGDVALTINSIALAGTNPGDFATLDNSCSSTIQPLANCSFLVTFTPTAVGARSATVNLSFGGGLAAQTVALQGTSGIPAFQSGPNPLDFGSVAIGSSSYLSNMSVTFTNIGTAPLNVSSGITITGTNSSDFCTLIDEIGGFTCAAIPAFSVAPGASGAIPVGFGPRATGTRTAQLTLVTDDPGSPHMFTLNGTGLPELPSFTIAPPVGFQTPTVSAGKSATMSVLLSSTSWSGTVDLTCTITPVVTPAPTCSLPASVNLTAGTAQTPAVTVGTTAPGAAAMLPSANSPQGPTLMVWIAILFASGLMFVSNRRRLGVLTASTIVVVLIAMAGCGGGSGSSSPTTGTPAGTYTVTVTATSGSVSQQTALYVIVQ
jgi:hypothetical protein